MLKLIIALICVLTTGCATYAKQWIAPDNRQTKEQWLEDHNRCARASRTAYASARAQAHASCMESLGYTANYVEVH